MIGDGFLLTYDCEEAKTMNLYKVDYKNSSINLLDSIECGNWIQSICVDQLNPLKFMLYIHGNKFSMGKIENEKILLSDVKTSDRNINYNVKRLMDNKLQYFDCNEESIQFCDLNLDTMERSYVNASFDLDDESLLSIKSFGPDPHCWTENQFYAMFKTGDSQYHLLMFDLNELKWLNVQIMANSPKSLFVDLNDVLTLQVGDFYGNNAFYRIALRKPEKLENLAHFTILNQSTLYGKDKYLKCVGRLPIIG